MVVPTADSSDETLAARAAAGDDRAFEEIVARYERRVFRLACRLTSETDAPDVLQNTFLQVYRNLPSFRGESRFATWLYRIATNAALMIRRASRSAHARDRRPGTGGHTPHTGRTYPMRRRAIGNPATSSHATRCRGFV